MGESMQRRSFLRLGAQLAGAAALGAPAASQLAGAAFAAERRRATQFGSVLDGLPADSGIDTVVIVMMENRSFDSYLGWLADSPSYLSAGRSRYGSSFQVLGRRDNTYRAPDGTMVATAHHSVAAGPADDFRGCGHPDPGHSWNAGRAERDNGFLATASGNDRFALSWFTDDDLPVYSELARRFTVCDRWHASLLGPTYPNRLYLLSAQSGGWKSNHLPFLEGGYQWPAIFDRFAAVGISVADYASDFGPFLLFGDRAVPYMRSIADFHADCAAGTLPQVCFVDPSFLGDTQNDDHPLADPRAGQQFVLDTFAAFSASPQWQRGLFIVTYDEWGGFFDHMAPARFADDRSSRLDTENFGQAGFRVPTFIASPYALPGFVDHAPYDHTSVMRFLEWRFLGAPAHGAAAAGHGHWWMTRRDRAAKNLGRSLSPAAFDPDPRFDVHMQLAPPSADCAGGSGAQFARAIGTHPFADAVQRGYLERIGARLQSPHV